MSTKIQTEEKQYDKVMQLGEWLQQWDLQQYEVLLQKNGIKKPNDFRFIKTKQHFTKVMDKLGAEMSIMDTLKIEDAWLSIIGSPQQEEKKQQQVHFLSPNANRVLNRLMLRYKDLSDDINIVQMGCNEFSKSSVQCKKDINKFGDEMIQCIERRRKQLLNYVDSMASRSKFDEVLKQLQAMDEYCKHSKDKFEQISVNNQLTRKQKEKEMNKLLAIDCVAMDDSMNAIDEKKEYEQKEAINYNHYKSIGDRRKIPKNMQAVFQTTQFENGLNSFFCVKYDETDSPWTLKPDYRNFLKDARYKIKSVKTGLCIDVKNNSSSIGGVLHQAISHNRLNQRFFLSLSMCGFYTVKCGNSGLFWKMQDGRIIQDTNDGGDDQLFGFFQILPEKYCIISKSTNKSVHVPDTSQITEQETTYSREQLFYCKVK